MLVFSGEMTHGTSSILYKRQNEGWGGKKVAEVVYSPDHPWNFSAFSWWLQYVCVNLKLFWSLKHLSVEPSKCVPVSKVDNDSRVSSSQDSSHCMLAVTLDPSFINKMLGCRLQDPDIVCEHILNLDPWVHSRCQLRKTGGDRVQKGKEFLSFCLECQVTGYIQRDNISG